MQFLRKINEFTLEMLRILLLTAMFICESVTDVVMVHWREVGDC